MEEKNGGKMEYNMLIPPDYTPIQVIVPNDNQCLSIYNIWKNIYSTNETFYSYVSCISLAKKYNLIYALIKTDKLKEINFPYTEVPISSAGNIEFYKLNENNYLVIKEENNIKEIVTFDGSQSWYQNGKLHRDNDLPALILPNGSQFWYKNGEFHRDSDLPALVYSNGRQEWYQNGRIYRDNGLPAIITANGTQYWYKNGELHRDNDLPAVINPDGRKLWYKNGIIYDYPS